MKKRTLRTAGVATALFRLLLHPAFLKETLRFLFIVMKYFFFNQWIARRIPVVDVSHPLDEKIPYDNRYSPLYIDFIKNWIRAVSWMFQRQGAAFAPQAADFVRGLNTCYKEAGWVYNQKKTTTPRPPAGKNKLTQFIQGVDPHLHCIPSLHVVVVCYTYIRFREFVETMEDQQEAAEARLFLYQRALMITESILYMKQHSLNCIGASLFFLHHLFPEYADREAARFVDDLFVLLETDLPIEDEARRAILDRYQRMRSLEEEHREKDYREIILESLKDYPSVPQK